ncbi:MAG: hypothetical protein ABH877_00030, partial [bacterium]
MASFQSPFPSGMSMLVVTLLLVVLTTLGGQQAASQDATTLTSQTPTWDDLGARRLCAWVCEDWGVGTSPDGRFLYGTATAPGTVPEALVSTAWGGPREETFLVRLSTAPGQSDDRRGVSYLVLRALGKGRFGLPIVSPNGTRLAIPARMPGDEPNTWQDPETWIVDAETGADLQVIRGVGGGAWHPDGQSLVVSTPEGLVSVSLVDNTRRVIVPGSEGPRGARVSPDGRFVAYLREEDTHVAALDGSWRGPVLGADGLRWPPHWTPDGTALIYYSQQRGVSELWGVEIAEGRAVGPPRVLLTNSEDGLDEGPQAILADGTLFTNRAGYRSDVYTVEIDPETLELRGEPQSVFGGEGSPNAGGTISPDGTLMAFFTRPSPYGGLGSGWLPAVRDLTTKTDRWLDIPRELSNGRPPVGAPPPRWSPDGRYLLYGPANNNLYLVDLVTGDQRWLFEDAPGETVGPLGWLPDGHTLVYGASSPTESGWTMAVRRHDVATGAERELWRGPVETACTHSCNLSPDGRSVALYRQGGSWWEASSYRALSILELGAGEIRELHRQTGPYCGPSQPSAFPSHQWTRSGREILVVNCREFWEDWGDRNPMNTFYAVPVDGSA